MSRNTSIAAGAALVALCTAWSGAALAYGPPPIQGPGPGYGMRPFDGIDRQEAVRAARSEGLDRVEEISTRGPRWVLKGLDHDDRVMTVVVDGRTNGVVGVRYYD